MSQAALMERAPAGGADSSDPAPTLDALFAETWIDLCGHRATECPLCGETMSPVYGAHARPVGGRCDSCGTEVR